MPLVSSIALLVSVCGLGEPNNPSGRIGRWTSINGLPNGKLADAPVIGNGYTGVVLGERETS